jgi:nucleoside-diphosphate-sugar epimerase
MRAVVRGCDVVYHLAAIYRTWVPDPRLLYDVNVTGSANVLAAAAEAGVRKVVYTSSIAAVGVREDGVPSDETTPFNLWQDSFDYVRSKYLGQQVALSFAPLVDVTVVGPGMPLGPGDIGPTPTGKTLLDALSGRIRVCFEGGLNIVDVEDVACGHLLAEERGGRGACYLLTGHNLTIYDLIAELRRVLGVRHTMYAARRRRPRRRLGARAGRRARHPQGAAHHRRLGRLRQPGAALRPPQGPRGARLPDPPPRRDPAPRRRVVPRQRLPVRTCSEEHAPWDMLKRTGASRRPARGTRRASGGR